MGKTDWRSSVLRTSNLGSSRGGSGSRLLQTASANTCTLPILSNNADSMKNILSGAVINLSLSVPCCYENPAMGALREELSKQL